MRPDVRELIEKGLVRAREQHPDSEHGWADQYQWLAAVTEELGEIATSINDGDMVGVEREIIDLAAGCAGWLEEIQQQRKSVHIFSRTVPYDGPEPVPSWFEEGETMCGLRLFRMTGQLEGISRGWMFKGTHHEVRLSGMVDCPRGCAVGGSAISRKE